MLEGSLVVALACLKFVLCHADVCFLSVWLRFVVTVAL